MGRTEPDILFPEERVIVEIDSWGYHSDREAFESDRDRDAERLAAGIETVRVTEERLTAWPVREAERMHAILRARRRVA
jgi:very-short-patch-repair endonuclease